MLLRSALCRRTSSTSLDRDLYPSPLCSPVDPSYLRPVRSSRPADFLVTLGPRAEGLGRAFPNMSLPLQRCVLVPHCGRRSLRDYIFPLEYPNDVLVMLDYFQRPLSFPNIQHIYIVLQDCRGGRCNLQPFSGFLPIRYGYEFKSHRGSSRDHTALRMTIAA